MSTTQTISVKPTRTWIPIKIEGPIPAPYHVGKSGLKVTPLHPTFGCELEGVDWSKDISPELYQDIRNVVDKVLLLGGLSLLACSANRPKYGVVV